MIAERSADGEKGLCKSGRDCRGVGVHNRDAAHWVLTPLLPIAVPVCCTTALPVNTSNRQSITPPRRLRLGSRDFQQLAVQFDHR